MTLPASGAISLFDVNDELGLTHTAAIGLLCTNVRTLFGVASGAVGMQTGYGKANCPSPGSVTYSTPGTYTWTAPTGVRHVSIVAIGGGGGGTSGNGGGGGGLGWTNNLTTTPGTAYTVYVGAGGTRHFCVVAHPGVPYACYNNGLITCCFGSAGTGGTSYTTIPGSPVGYGGTGAPYSGGASNYNSNYSPYGNTCATGGGYSGTGGGNGGDAETAHSKTCQYKWVGGGGGGGYTGKGGTAKTSKSLYYTGYGILPGDGTCAGCSGGGGPGYTTPGYQSPGQNAIGRAGGGTGVSAGKTVAGPCYYYARRGGQGGSNGTIGGYPSIGGICRGQNPNGSDTGIYIYVNIYASGNYYDAAGGSVGGGGGTSYGGAGASWPYVYTAYYYCGYNGNAQAQSQQYPPPGGQGGPGAVRILWNGNVRSYPKTCTGSP